MKDCAGCIFIREQLRPSLRYDFGLLTQNRKQVTKSGMNRQSCRDHLPVIVVVVQNVRLLRQAENGVPHRLESAGAIKCPCLLQMCAHGGEGWFEEAKDVRRLQCFL